MKKALFLLSVLFLITSCCNATQSKEIFDNENKKANVILLAGGEDCLGYSYTYHLQETSGVSEEIFNEYVNGYEDVKISYKNMLNTNLVHKMETNFVPTKVGQGKAPEEGVKYGNIGPELGLAEYLSKIAPQEEFYIIKFAGGSSSSIKYEWNPDGGTYYKEMTSFFNNQLNKLENSGVEFDVSSFLFVQGETDSKNGTLDYDYYLSKFIRQIKLDYYKYSPDNGMSFIDAGVSSHYLINFRRINDNKKEVLSFDNRDFFIDTIASDISRNKDNKDRLHYDAIGQIKLGHLFAKAVLMKLDQKIVNDEQIILEDEYKSSNTNYNFEFVNNGELIKSNFEFVKTENNFKLSVDVIDSYLSKNDGINIDFVVSNSSRTLSNSPLFNVSVNLENNITYKKYTNIDDSMADILTHNIFSKVSNLSNDNKNIGYHIDVTIPFDLVDKDVYLNYGIINNNKIITNYNDVNPNDINSYLLLNDEGLTTNPNYLEGSFFGSLNVNKMTYGWDLSLDQEQYGEIQNPYGQQLNYVFAKNSGENKLNFRASFSAKYLFNFDLYPKFGLLLVDEEFNGIFYYVDAYGTTGYDMIGTNLGYCTIKNGVFENYSNFNYVLGLTSSYAYLNDNYIELALERNEDQYSFYCNNNLVTTIQNVTNLGLGKAYYGINSFNTYISVKYYGYF